MVYVRLLEEIERYRNERVYKTRKARINAEDRYLQYNDYSHIVLNISSISMIALSVLTLAVSNKNFDVLNLIISIYLLGVTLIVTGFNFKGKADEHKISYIEITKVEAKLDRLYSTLRDEKLPLRSNAYAMYIEIKNEYIDILEKTLNHKNIDYEKAMNNSNVKVVLREWSRKIIFLSLCIFPVLIVFLKIVFFDSGAGR
ncbi:TPA: SLATT domain-containing protein [Listeria monocytogenes]|nr:SLATT domain-containing protein [Listeria monocytogenes]